MFILSLREATTVEVLKSSIMDVQWSILFLLWSIVLNDAWQTLENRRYNRALRGDLHYHSKRHMLPREVEAKRRAIPQLQKEGRKKPSGHLKPLNEDDIENDEVVSVAIGPPAIRPKYEKVKHMAKSSHINPVEQEAGTKLVKDVLTQLGREFLTHQVSEDFVFGQYIGNAMRNLTSELKLKMQHEILELMVKYQKITNGEVAMQTATPQAEENKMTTTSLREIKDKKDFKDKERKNDTDEGWPDFSNLAKIVGK